MEHNTEFDYTMWSDGANSGGGFVHLEDENADGKILVYIASDDIDADLKQVTASGGTVIKPKTEIPGMGWYAVFQDPSGNRLAVYASQNP
jgi:predicted enzyme related to lactoylglutathione lyase